MNLLFDVSSPYFKWTLVDNRKIFKHRALFTSGWQKVVSESIADINSISSVGYILHHGGETIKQPVSRITPDTLMELEKIVAFHPESREMILEIIHHWKDQLSDIPHVLLCNTAFFLDLPPEASTYAIPLNLRVQGIRKYGGGGLYHEWAWNEVKKITSGKSHKVISVFLGNHTNITAIEDGKPLETTIGFTSVEGIPSIQSCGDIDPTIIFELFAQGASIEEINQILSKKSGFSGLLGKRCSIMDIFKNDTDQKVAEIRELLIYNILKHIGAFIAAMNGVDAIVFFSKNMDESLDFILKLGDKLNCLDIKWKSTFQTEGPCFSLSTEDSDVAVFCLKFNKWDILARRMKVYKR